MARAKIEGFDVFESERSASTLTGTQDSLTSLSQSHQSSIRDYEKLGHIGRGSFGSVDLCRSRGDQQLYAIKEMNFDELADDRKKDIILREIRMTSLVHHPYVINYHEAFYDNHKIHIVLEHCAGGTVKEKLRLSSGALWPESLVLRYTVFLCLAVKHLHDNKIVHRDLKTENIFLTGDDEIRLGDFGLARVLVNGSYCTTPAGSPEYLAPEIVQQHPYNEKADIWALGICIYEMLSGGKVPFTSYTRDIDELRRGILVNQPPPLNKRVYSRNIIRLVSQLLNKNAAQRPSISEVLSSSIMQGALMDYVPSVEMKVRDANDPTVEPFTFKPDPTYTDYRRHAKKKLGKEHIAQIQSSIAAHADRKTRALQPSNYYNYKHSDNSKVAGKAAAVQQQQVFSAPPPQKVTPVYAKPVPVVQRQQVYKQPVQAYAQPQQYYQQYNGPYMRRR